ncbi:hypothetical protein [Winogradskyella sp. UBA3174]|uniref:hypothetical protein n=1 Tax=Winogradskyella sp. UBA3174 TaxID=1947785 RepID=UPI0025E5C95B|nr:hypothetical protein [Winogradskyella sp. UBA3174]|tara:strand:- start:1374 stop:2030 length:657 start_codon:yes stop_codon:yes gene_type:complete
MEKSIENIWKEGFLKSDALLAPKINNLYNQKSIHVIDKFKRMFKINLIAIVAFSIIFLIVSFIVGIPWMGILFFIALNILVMINKKLLTGLEKIDKGDTSYQYLKAFNLWIKKQVSINKRISTFLYPIIFMSFIIGFWFKDAEGVFLGKRLVNEILIGFPDVYLIYGIPLLGIVVVLIISVLLAIFGGRIYQWDLNIVYGRVFKKLEELLADMERLND